ncbi:MAG: 50S ribosomal protein L9 [Candidatus Pacebacteria bacterium]|nr:50S ribosomal protein L9 [Candidatus Paceibacterota bacterium]
MKVILLQNVPKIGKKFDVKEVASGHALNFLIPRKQAKIATDKAIKEMEVLKEKHEELTKVENEKVLTVINKIKDTKIEMLVNANEEGKLFAGIGAKEIAEEISKQLGETINSEIIELANPIKEVGEHSIEINVEAEKIKIIVDIKSDK